MGASCVLHSVASLTGCTVCTYFVSILLKKSIFSRRGSKAPRKGDFNAPRVVNIDKKGSPLLSRRDSRLIILLCLWAVV